MKETEFQSLFTKWFPNARKAINMDHSMVKELKVTNTHKFEFKNIKPHQIPFLLRAKHDCVYYKISDQSLGLKPFDCFQVCRVPAYLIILFYKPRQLKVPIWIDVDKFVEFQKTSRYKYITEDQAKEIGISFGGI